MLLHYIIMQKKIFFCDKMRKILFIRVNTESIINHRGDTLHYWLHK